MSLQPPRDPPEDEPAGVRHERSELTRRSMIAGTAVTSAAITIGVGAPTVTQADGFGARAVGHATNADVAKDKDIDVFVRLSAALTGIGADVLRPKVDPLGLARIYFNWVDEREPVDFESLLHIARQNDSTPQGIIKGSQARDDTKYLARSIVLMWYLGSWYAPRFLRQLVESGSSAEPNPNPHTVISPKTYTQGFLWRIAQAHPMGYSDMQFGYWTREPPPLDDFIGNRTQPKGT